MKVASLVLFFSLRAIASPLNELSLNQDLYNAKLRSTAALGQIKIFENELKRNQELFAINQVLIKADDKAISEEEGKKSELTVVVTQFNLEEAKALYDAAKADEKIYEVYLSTQTDEQNKIKQIKEYGLAMWTARNRAARAAVSKNEAELNFEKLIYIMNSKLFEQNAASKQRLLLAARDFKKAEATLQRAKDFERVTAEAMKKFE